MLSFFPSKFKPRPQQEEVLREIEEHWKSTDVFIIRAPVGGGKSYIAETVAKYAQSLSLSTTICTPTNVLVRQYENGAEEGTFTTAPSRSSFGKDDRAWEIAKQQFKDASIKLCNNYTYLALRAYSDVAIFDEAHKLIPMLTEMDGIKIWRHLSGYPQYMPTILHFMQWAAESDDRRVLKLLEKLKAHPTLYTMSHEIGEFRGQEKELLNVRPLSPKNSKPVLWPGCVKKIFLMSATIGLPDVAELGLDRRRVRLIDVSSPIPAERRPIVYDPIGSMAVHSQNKNMEKAVKYILDTASVYKDKGLVHCTYGLAAKLRPYLASHERFIFHTNLDKAKKLKQWLKSPPEEGKILIACGLTEGLDVKGDLGRFQIILKIQYPDQSDIAVAEKMRQDPDWYAQQAIRELEQAVGRICRSEDDFGVSFILDSCFAKLYTEHRDKFSLSFREALT